MPRQRLRARPGALNLVGRVLVALLALALVWYGLMMLLLAVKVAPGDVNSISGYRSAYDWLARLGPSDVDGSVRPIAAVAGLVAFFLLGYLALKQIPRPYLARRSLELEQSEPGSLTVAPRAVERVAEQAALEQPEVDAALGRAGAESLDIELHVDDPAQATQVLERAGTSVAEALERHGLPHTEMNVILAGYARRNKREPDR